jgi:hypothetical protein
MFCTTCGNKIADNSKFCAAKFCAVCGSPISAQPPQHYVPPKPSAVIPHYNQAAPMDQQPLPMLQQINIAIPHQQPARTTKWATPRLVIGIITIALFFLLQFQSCVAGIGESLKSLISEDPGSTGAIGYAISFFFLAAGIVSITCRKSKGGSIVAGVVYAFCGAAMTAGDFSYFSDLAFYCILSCAFAGIMLIGGIVQKD